MLLDPAHARELLCDDRGLEVIAASGQILDLGAGPRQGLLDAPFQLVGTGHATDRLARPLRSLHFVKLWTRTWREDRDQLHREGRREGPGVPLRAERRRADLGPACWGPRWWLLGLPVRPGVRHPARRRRGVRGPRASHPRGPSEPPVRPWRDRRLRRHAAGRRLQGGQPQRGRRMRLRLLVSRGRGGGGLRGLAVAGAPRRVTACGMTRSRALAMTVAVLGSALAACGGSDQKKPQKTPAPPASRPVTRAEKPLRGLAVGITEPNANFVFPPGMRQLPPEFARWAKELDAMRPGFYRMLLDWPSLEPQPGKPNFEIPNEGCLRGTPPCGPYKGLRDQLAALAAQQKRGGWQALVVIVGTPDWAARRQSGCERDGTTARSRAPRSDQLSAYEAFVGKVLALAREEGADLRYWSPWNEPNHPYALSPQRTRCSASAPTVAPKRYAEIAQSLQRALDAASADQELVLGELAGLPKSRPYTTGISEFIRALPKQLVCSVTVWTQHGYVGGVNPVDDVERGLAAHHCRVPHAIWMTETGVGAAGRGRKRSATEEKQRGTCAQRHPRLLQWYRDKRVTAAFQYTVREDDVFPVGLVTTDLTDAYPSLEEWTAW